MITDWSTYQIPYNGVTYQMHYRDAVNLVACEDYVPNSPSPDYPSPIVSTGEVSGIDLTVTGNAGQSYQVHRDMVLRSLPDGTCDTWDAVTGAVTRNVGVNVFDGTETTIGTHSANNEHTCFFIEVTGYSVAKRVGYCTHFPFENFIVSRLAKETFFPASNGTRFLFVVQNSRVSTIVGFRAWLAAQHAAGTPVTVLYKLATPTIEQIDPMALPTYPRYTRLECNAQTRAAVRVVDGARM